MSKTLNKKTGVWMEDKKEIPLTYGSAQSDWFVKPYQKDIVPIITMQGFEEHVFPTEAQAIAFMKLMKELSEPPLITIEEW